MTNNIIDTKDNLPSTHPAIDLSPQKYIQEAQLLLAFSAQKGLEVDESIVAVIVKAKHMLDEKQWTVEMETEFWMAFNALAKLVSPVSVESLRATRSMEQGIENSAEQNTFIGMLRYMFGQGGHSIAERTVNGYQRASLIGLVFLLICQIYWVVGSAIISDIEDIPQQIDALEQDIDALERQAQPDDFQSRILLQKENKIQEYESRIDASYDTLSSWNKVWQFKFFSPPEEAKKTASEVVKERFTLQQNARFVLQVLQLYLLPLLYGLLGACVYVLRMLTVEMRNLTYEVESNIRYHMRVQLGALSGLAIGWFAASPSIGLSLSAVSPFALAFLAGYSVEVLFAIMDGLIASFSNYSKNDNAQSYKDGMY